MINCPNSWSIMNIFSIFFYCPNAHEVRFHWCVIFYGFIYCFIITIFIFCRLYGVWRIWYDIIRHHLMRERLDQAFVMAYDDLREVMIHREFERDRVVWHVPPVNVDLEHAEMQLRRRIRMGTPNNFEN